MHRAVAAIAAPGAAVLVPTAAAGRALRQTLDRGGAGRGADLVTRDDFYVRLHSALPSAPPMLSAFEREVLLSRAAHVAEEHGAAAPFRLRPGLLVEILAFYDELRRRDRTVADFDRLMTDSLASSVDVDRGAERLFRQTRFLVAAFAEFERLVAASGGVDEHALRARLLTAGGPPAFTHVVVTVPDQVADARGLWTADFDLLARLPGLARIDVVVTETLLAAGFHERLHDLLPGIEEDRVGGVSPPPVLIAPPASATTPVPPWFVSRDREEELVAVARQAARSDDASRMGVAFQRPLPYLYLARYVFEDAGRRYQAFDTLPLAAEPFAAALDVVLAFVLAEATRATTIDLLASPHWRFAPLEAGDVAGRESLAALDVMLRERKYLGGWDRLDLLAAAGAPEATRPRARRKPSPAAALEAAAAAAAAVRPLREAATASAQVRALLAFIEAHERTPDADAAWSARHLRTRAAIVDALSSLARAYEGHDDSALPLERLAGVIRRWIDGQTFAPDTDAAGVLLVDARAAAYADLDELTLVGLIENDWPERVRRSIFYPSSLLTQLGWPSESDRLLSARARFRDLLLLPARRVSVSTFTLEDDAIVSGSAFLQEAAASGLAVERPEPDDPAPLAHESLIAALPPPAAEEASAGAAAWLALRASRSPADGDVFRGSAGARPPIAYAISHVERYLDCPFKYFAARVLSLDEERDDESGLTPQERGQLLHEVFETFFKTWHERGGRAITAATLNDALDLFATVAEETLSRLPEADRALERNYLLGSAASAGLGERAFSIEIEQETGLVERLLEHPLEGTFTFRGADGPRRIAVRAKADRIDLLENGGLRIIDYKLSRAPKAARALQLPIYGVCAQQSLEGRGGRSWTVASAGYVAFKEKNAFVPLGSSSSLAQALEEGEKRLVAAVDGIEQGSFPVKPDEPYRCRWCGYAAVCRKDYIGDE